MTHNTTLSIATLNVRSISGTSKSDQVFHHLNSLPAKIIFLQETHVYSTDQIQSLSDKWGGKSFWSPGSPGSCGTAILFKPNCNFNLIDFKRDLEGRVMSVLISYGNLKLNLVSIYAPNTLRLRKLFFRNLHEYFFTGSELIIGGDFNCIDSEKDKYGGNSATGFAGKEEIAKLKADFLLSDIWRKQNSRVTQFTWLNSDATIACRLDKFLISNDLVKCTRNCEIKACHLSDHDLVFLSLDTRTFCNRGPGIWRLNTSILTDPNYVKLIESFFDSNPRPENISLGQWWDFLKNQIRLKTGSFCKEKLHNSRKYRQDLSLKLIRAKQRIIAGDASAAQEVKDIENDLKILGLKELEGVKIRSRSQWIENGEKPSRYFFSLEKKRANENFIPSLLDKDGIEVSSNEDLFKVTTDFYKSLFMASPTDDEIQAEFIANLDASLSPEDANLCEGLITFNELHEAASQMALSKTPGMDGLPVEFYLKFWGKIGKIILDVLNESFHSGSLPSSQKISIIRLIHKKSDKRLLKNWRPISLLNVDYKLAAKVLANRLRKVLHRIIHEDQTCSVPGRSISDHLNLIRDVLKYIDKTGENGIIVNLDQEKAFDRVDRNYLQNVLQKFGFGDSFKHWVNILYNGANSKIMVNGFLTASVDLERGVRQGCPLSPLLYILLAEVLGSTIRKRNDIEGFRLPGAAGLQFKVAQYADDTTSFIRNFSSLSNLLTLFERYEKGTGAKLNASKTEAMWVGAWRFRPDCPFNLKWVTKLEILGGVFSQQNVEQENWQPKLKKLEKVLDLWSSRELSFVGRSLIINVLGASLFWYLLKVFVLPAWVKAAFDRLVWAFLWKGRTETIKRKVLNNSLHNGGLSVVNIEVKAKALLLSNLFPFLEFSRSCKWHYFARYYLGRRLAFLDQRWHSLSVNNVPNSLLMPDFYRASFEALKESLSSGSLLSSTKKCYDFLITKVSERPTRIRDYWSFLVGSTFNWSNLWRLVRDTSTENVKNDLIWLIIMRGVKVRSLLKKWNYINYDHCSFCRLPETIEHCFFDCRRLEKVWRQFHPFISKLSCLSMSFRDLVFLSGNPSDPRSIVVSFIVKTIIYEIWCSRNRATFRRTQDTPEVIIQNIRHEMSYRIKHEFGHLRLAPFEKLWTINNCLCKVNNDNLIINV